VRRLTKEESLPKHIKLKLLITKELNRNNEPPVNRELTDVVNQIFEDAANQQLQFQPPANAGKGPSYHPRATVPP
jgi:hypothetical protein